MVTELPVIVPRVVVFWSPIICAHPNFCNQDSWNNIQGIIHFRIFSFSIQSLSRWVSLAYSNKQHHWNDRKLYKNVETHRSAEWLTTIWEECPAISILLFFLKITHWVSSTSLNSHNSAGLNFFALFQRGENRGSKMWNLIRKILKRDLFELHLAICAQGPLLHVPTDPLWISEPTTLDCIPLFTYLFHSIRPWPRSRD